VSPDPTDEALRAASDLFHKILASFSAERLLARGGKLTQPIRDSMTSQILAPEKLEQLAADGFEICVRALAARGAADVSIHECNPDEHDQ
jgi:hypothetical protein